MAHNYIGRGAVSMLSALAMAVGALSWPGPAHAAVDPQQPTPPTIPAGAEVVVGAALDVSKRLIPPGAATLPAQMSVSLPTR